MNRETFDRQIQAPIVNWLSSHFAQDRILFIVFTKGVPLRIQGTSGRDGTVASVDSELAALYRRLAGTRTPCREPGLRQPQQWQVAAFLPSSEPRHRGTRRPPGGSSTGSFSSQARPARRRRRAGGECST